MTDQHLGVVVIVQSQQQQVLLGKRKNSYKAGFYGLPGGRVEPGEKLLAAALRELGEETGLESAELEYRGFVKELQDGYDFVHFVFICEKWSGEPQCTEPDKCEGWEWFDLDQLPAQVLPGHRGGLLLQEGGQPFLEV